MAELLLTIFAVVVLAPAFIPWGKVFTSYTICTWFLLWALFFFQMERESIPRYDGGIISDSIGIIFFIIVFIIVVSVRSLFQVVLRKLSANRKIKSTMVK